MEKIKRTMAILLSTVLIFGIAGIVWAIQSNNGMSPTKTYTCTEESVKRYVTTEFAVDHTVDKEAVQILQSELQQLYGKEILSTTVKVTSEGKEIPFYVLCSTGKVYPYEKPSFQEVTGIQKISPELWEKMQTVNQDDTLKLVVSIKEPAGMMKVSYQVIDDTELSKLERSIKEKMEAVERGEKVNLTELNREKAIFETEKEKVRQKVEAEYQTVIENNRRLLKPIKEQVLQKLQEIPGIRITSGENEIIPAIGIETNLQNIEKIQEISEVSSISIDSRLTGTSDV